VDFTADLIDQLSVSEQQFKVGVLRYFGSSGCTTPNVGNYTRFISELTTDKDALLQLLASDSLRQLVPPCGGYVFLPWKTLFDVRGVLTRP